MARKGLLTSITAPEENRTDNAARAEYARRGASRAMMMSLDEIAQNSSRLLEGEAVVSLDTALIDDSPVIDRMEPGVGGDQDYSALVEAIRADGQASPVLVRPSPTAEGRYVIVFGRRRLRAARELGLPLRAVIKPMEEVAAIIAQGQENSARADLTFIERALFARKLLDLGHTKETVKSALTIDDSLLSRMLSVVDTIPAAVITDLGPAKGIGRDRWEELKKAVQKPAHAQAALQFLRSPLWEFNTSQERFNHMLDYLRTLKPLKRSAAEPVKRWMSIDSDVSARVEARKKQVSITLSGVEDNKFGVWLGENLDQLYRNFRSKNGD